MRSVHAALGATHPLGGEQITLFIPSKDRDGQAIDQDRWSDEALAAMARMFRGATAFPPGKGAWRDDAKGGVLLREVTVMIVSYAQSEELKSHLGALRSFLHRFGRMANQGEVGIVVSGRYYGISKYDPT